jgi:hypothetical protein
LHRVDADGHQDNKFFDGNSTGAEKRPATVLPAIWLNDVQESICRLIESRGAQPTKGDGDQLGKLVGEPLNAIEREISHLKEEVAKLWVKVG